MQQSLLVLTLTCLAVLAACTDTGTAAQLRASGQTVSSNGLEIEFVAADWRGSSEVWVTLCYDLPASDSHWLLGRLHGDVILTDGSTITPMSSVELIGWKLGPGGVAYQRCDRVEFPLAQEPTERIYTLTIRRIAADLPDEPDWTELQQRLDAANTGIRIEPLAGAEGFSFALVERPQLMSDREAHDIVVGMAGEVVEGPWEFEIRLRP